MYTRAQYMSGEITHRQYYGQYVNNRIRAIVIQQFGVSKLAESLQSDEHLNNIPLEEWDALNPLPIDVSLIRTNGDYLTLAVAVCITKEAAQQVVEAAFLEDSEDE